MHFRRLRQHASSCNFDFKPIEIVLDSGADISALPRSFCQVGHQRTKANEGSFVDAQGGELQIQDVRVGKIQFGDVSFKERFIITDVSCPLTAFGNIIKAGWSLHSSNGRRWLEKN